MRISVGEAMRLLRLDRSTIWRWCENGKLKSQRDHRGWRLLDKDEIIRVAQKIGAIKEFEIEIDGMAALAQRRPSRRLNYEK